MDMSHPAILAAIDGGKNTAEGFGMNSCKYSYFVYPGMPAWVSWVNPQKDAI
jgi:hypothetical protein